MGWEIAGYREVLHGHLHVDGVSTQHLVERYGTPLFVFSESRVKANVHELLESAQRVYPRVRLCYAAKANSLLAILRAVREAGADIEVNSGGELYKALRAGFQPEQIVFNGVSKTPEELEDAIRAEIYAINVDSLAELEMIATLAERLGKRANVALRLVPEVETGSHAGLQTALLTSKFGFSPSEITEALRRALACSRSIHLVGLHVHVGSQTPTREPYVRAFTMLWRLALDLYRETGHRVRHVNLGGGLPIIYAHDERAMADVGERRQLFRAAWDIGALLQAVLKTALEDGAARDLLEGLEIIFEPGRRVVADAGTLLVRIRNLKTRPETGDTWLFLDAGTELLPSMSHYKWYYHVISADRTAEPHEAPYKLAGPLCDGGDVYFDIEGTGQLPQYRFLPKGLSIGNILAILDVGAYTVAQMSNYNGRPFPAILWITSSGDVRLIRPRQSYEDLVKEESV
ncbi:MAG: diaminopimelate decarboxylase [Blastocatellia bacterium]|nr:diaminopimelate decarboxylase [Blastocatellia bacterium]MCS7157965.1 diaminopimelate decarboxylase [Blastocatellia bacterium]MCX7752472.1 diaminopimelate decarboxylase [Blastocatellia bacterium]MDW8167413.1 diaminopimelate decarboxylase [Acidobacteriota bacterium]MDW8257409.1 diaminopimelate decarboxylase [Acidobacteriota bacterium]